MRHCPPFSVSSRNGAKVPTASGIAFGKWTEHHCHEGAERQSRSVRQRLFRASGQLFNLPMFVQKCANEPSRELQPEARQFHARNLRSPFFSRLGWHCIRERAGGYDLARLHRHARLEALHFLH